jgi:peptidylprolyl isomerase
MRSLALAVLFSVVAAAQFVIPPPPDVAAPPADATKTPSGLAFKITKPGTSTQHPKTTDLVMINYTGWTTDGKMFETSIGRSVQTMPLSSRIPGLVEGIQQMVPGETRLFWIPEALAYKGVRGPKGMVVYEIDLVASMPNSKP